MLFRLTSEKIFPTVLLTLALVSLPFFIWLGWGYFGSVPTLTTLTENFSRAGENVKTDLTTLPAVTFTENTESYDVTAAKEGIDIQFADQEETLKQAGADQKASPLTLSFPKDYTKPVEVKLDDRRIIRITDLSAQTESGYAASTIVLGSETSRSLGDLPASAGSTPNSREDWFRKILPFGSLASKLGERPSSTLNPNPQTLPPSYLRYQSGDKRKELLYAFQQDTATGEKKLKHWTLYQEGNGIETESYQFANAKIKLNESGEAEVFYFGEQDLKNEQAAAEVSPDLMARAQRTLAKEMGEEMEQNILAGKQTPDFIIPAPYYINSQGERKELAWQMTATEESGEKLGRETSKLGGKGVMLSVTFAPAVSEYPLALDPTLSFTAPGMSNSMSNTGSVITGQATSNLFGTSLTSGDFNADGKTDLAVGAYGYSTNTGRAYLFYNDGSIPTTAATADVTITGETTSNFFGYSLTSGDFNADGKTDLAVGAYGYSTNTGRAYLFYNDGSIPTTAATADVTITGETTSYFGRSLTSGDFNSDGRTDLAVGAYGYSSFTGRAYLFYNDGSIPTTAGSADVTINGVDTSDLFGISLTSGDFNGDGRTDLAVGAYGYSSFTGRAYLFYNDGSIPTTAITADVTITGETTSYFSISITAGDWNADGRTDLAVGAYQYSSSTGRAYIFYNDGSIPTTAATADVTITGETTSNSFGTSLTAGDFNADGKTDLAVGASNYSSSTGRAYIFYNDGSIPTTAATADVTITGETTSNSFGTSLTAGDFNADGRTDLAVGADNYSSQTGRTYIFYSQNGQVNTNQNIQGETTSNSFGTSLTTGDLNADGKTDLIVGASSYSSSTGRAYIFYNDGSIPTTAATADVIITGETTSNSFGDSLTTSDLNADGKTDLIVGAFGYSSSTGRAYIFYNGSIITENASGADVKITGETTEDSFGTSLTSGDLNADGKTDLIVGASLYSSLTGRAYLFYNDGSIPTTAGTADVKITGETTEDIFGMTLATGDLNADGRMDLIIGAGEYQVVFGDDYGRAYIFYNDGSIPTAAASADVIITGAFNENIGYSLATSDLNADGKTDLAVGAISYSSGTGRAYIFYNDGSIPTTTATADVTITGEATNNNFGISLTSGDFNADGKTDLAVGASGYSTTTGRTYLFYNDGSIPTTAATADVTITGEASNNSFGDSLTTSDLNADGKTDLIVGADGYSTNTGRVYIYETRDNFAWQLQEQSAVSDPLRVNPDFSGQELKITGQTNSSFGYAVTTGDLNSDGKTDLIVGAIGYSSNTGRAYIFYNDGSLTTSANSADVVITGETTSNNFGISLATGDLNADGKTDLAVGAYGYSSNTGRAYIFYNDGSIPTTAATADVIITGETTSNYFGRSLATGDLNADGKTDLAVGAYDYSFSTGRAYIFYNDGSIPTTAATADVIITGETISNSFSISLTTGDLNADGKTDLIVGAYGYSTDTGRAYIFYNDGSIPTTAATADVTITGETTNNAFGRSLATGDLNADGKTDLIVGASGYSLNTGRAYIFYNGSIITENASGADVIITGETTNNYFGYTLTTGDMNADGKTDLAVGAYGYSTNTGRVYLFYNDGSIPTTAATADLILTGETTSNYFGISLTTGDLNADGKTDLVVGAYGYASSKGRTYVYTMNDGRITGEATSNYFGTSLTTGDFNADGKTDLAVGAPGYSTDTGRAYIFYNDGSIPTTAATADVTITGEASSSFGNDLTAGDFNGDGKTDLAVGASGYSSGTGCTYLFYNDGTLPTTAATADVTIAGQASSNFGYSLATGDWNSDGKTDLAVGAIGYFSATGRAYIFYNGSIITENASGADVIITGESTLDAFGQVLTVGDMNADGRIDLIVFADECPGISNDEGCNYIFYNDGSIPTTADIADIKITGDVNAGLGYSATTADMNSDGRVDLILGSPSGSSSTGRAYLFYNDGSIPTTTATADVTITGETTNDFFGISLTSGDFNADGKTDLAVGATGYSSSTGRAYIFYNDGSIPTTAATADVIITGEASNNSFGNDLTVGDFNGDGKTDLAVGAYGYSSDTGRAYVFITEATKATLEATSQAILKGTQKFKGTLLFR